MTRVLSLFLKMEAWRLFCLYPERTSIEGLSVFFLWGIYRLSTVYHAQLVRSFFRKIWTFTRNSGGRNISDSWFRESRCEI